MRSPRSFHLTGVFGVELLNNINPDILQDLKNSDNKTANISAKKL